MGPNLFNSIKLQKPKNNVFDLTHDVKLSFNMGDLVPVCCLEAVPGDRFDLGCESLVRFAPMIAPVMHRMNLRMEYFFVPNRVIWPAFGGQGGWEAFITQTKDNATGEIPVFPTWNAGQFTATKGSLADYMGVPVAPVGGNVEKLSMLPFGAYMKIYLDYYADENLNSFGVGDYTDYSLGPQDYTAEMNPGTFLGYNVVRKRAWEHDYFTSALPFAQKGDDVTIPLGDVKLINGTASANPGGRFITSSGAGLNNDTIESLAVPFADGGNIKGATFGNEMVYDPNGSLIVGETTINELRRAEKLQEWLERNARAGTRYMENIFGHFGVRSSDKRLQRAEYIFGSRSPITVSEIVNTGGDSATLPQGNMAGHGLSAQAGRGKSYFCEEHGYIIGLMSVMPTTAYYQGVPRHFLKVDDAFQYFWPSFAHIGEQEVTNNEIYAYQGAASKNTFGYNPRYSEYKYSPSRVAGDFRDNLAYWHLARKFATPPALSEEFVMSDPRTDIFAVTDPNTQHLYAHVLNRVKAVRPMPKFGTPHW